MNLHGMDTVSVIATSLANKSLAGSANTLVTEFSYREGDAKIAGRFGPWQIVAGGSGKQLHVDIPITSGEISGLPRKPKISLSGLTARVTLSLRLIPAPTGKDVHHLCFDIEDTLAQNGAAVPLAIIDPDNRLSTIESRVLGESLSASLSENADDISYVFAQVGKAGAGPLEMPHHDWQYIETGDGKSFLAITGALLPISGEEDFDPLLLKNDANAVFALSKKAFCERILLPYLKSSFRPKCSFAIKKQQIVSTKPVHLPRLKSGLWWVEPTISKLTFELKKGELTVTAKTKSKMPLGTKFDCTVVSHLKYHLDARHQVGFQTDPKPKVTYSVGLPGVLDTLIGWFVNWIVSFFHKPIVKMVSGIATALQGMNSRAGQPVSWTGQRDFQTEKAELTSTCFWSADTRPT